jgi:hypothetical protein
MVKYGQRHLFGTSQCSVQAASLLSGDFDLALLAPSWDHRSECITECEGLSIGEAIVLLFSLRDEFGLRDQHEKRIIEFLGEHSSSIYRVGGDSVQVGSMWGDLWRRVREAAKTKGGALKLLVDLSACPRYYTIGTMAACIRLGIASTITFFYAEGIYAPQEFALPYLDYPFSAGQWHSVPVPFLEGDYIPYKRRFVLVSVGFQGVKTHRVLVREDPDRVSILFPKPGVEPLYEEEAGRRNAPMMVEFRVGPEQVINAPANDAIAVWKELARVAPERPQSENAIYLCCGTKPHSLGLALRALCLGYPTVMYNVPEKYGFVDVRPRGTYWTYTLRDLSAIAPFEADTRHG